VRTFSPLMFTLLLTAIFLTGCASNNNVDAPARAVESYLNALVAKDADRLSTLSCGEWEDDALLELDSFQAVTARLEGLTCEQTGTDGDTALVLCNGNIVATYNDEDQELDLSVRTYQVVEEGGEWLVCGTR
jgi:outer membrane lipoprotein-sorting protein